MYLAFQRPRHELRNSYAKYQTKNQTEKKQNKEKTLMYASQNNIVPLTSRRWIPTTKRHAREQIWTDPMQATVTKTHGVHIFSTDASGGRLVGAIKCQYSCGGNGRAGTNNNGHKISPLKQVFGTYYSGNAALMLERKTKFRAGCVCVCRYIRRCKAAMTIHTSRDGINCRFVVWLVPQTWPIECRIVCWINIKALLGKRKRKKRFE